MSDFVSEGQERDPTAPEYFKLITCVHCDAIRSMKLVNSFEAEDKWTCEVCGASSFVPKGQIPARRVDGNPPTQP